MAKETVEINGTKFEIDMNTAKRIDTFKVGDSVKLLEKKYSDSIIHDATIIGFYNFKNLPTIQVAMFRNDYMDSGIQIVSINADTTDYEIIPSTEYDLDLDKDKVLEQMDGEVLKKQHEIEELKKKRDWFSKYYGKYFKKEAAND